MLTYLLTHKKYKFEIVPIVVGALGAIPNNLLENLQSQHNWREVKANTEKIAESISNRDSENMQDFYENVN